MKSKIKQLIKDNPYNYSKLIRNDPAMYKWIIDNSLVGIENFPTAVYSAINQQSNICKNGNSKKFKSITDGYRFCGNASKCQCARESLSGKMVDINSKRDQKSIKQKRIATTLKRYNVENAGGTIESIGKAKSTSFEKYGVENYNYLEQAKEHLSAVQKELQKTGLPQQKRKDTVVEKYGVDNVSNLLDVKQKREQTMISKYGVANAMKVDSIVTAVSEKNKKYAIDNKEKIRYEAFIRSFNRLNDIDSRVDGKVTPNWDISDNTLWHGTGYHSLYPWKCNTCATEFEDNLYSGNVPECPSCFPKVISKAEVEIVEYIKSVYNGPIVTNKKPLKTESGIPRQLDIHLPEINVAFEYTGIYWHGEKRNDNKYHLQDKLKLSEANGIRLVTIFEDEWIFKPEIVKNRIMHIIGKTNKTIYARNCVIKMVSTEDIKDFLDMYHIQGSCQSSIKMGLYYGDELVSLMTLGKSRFAKDVDYELIRFVSSCNVIGAASKLFKHFCKTYTPNSVVSYCDLRWGTGKVYKLLGFECDEEYPEPSYYWCKNSNRYNRIKFQKHKLVKQGHDPALTEDEIVRNMGYYKIWDCGHSKWIWKNNKQNMT